MSDGTVKSCLKYHGGKHYLAKRIVAMMPRHSHYVEPYLGGASVLLAKPCLNVAEIVGDADHNVSNFWDVLRSASLFPRFQQLCQGTEFGGVVFRRAGWILDNPVESLAFADPGEMAVWRAWAFFVRARQSMAGRLDSFAPITRARLRGGMNEQVSAWLASVDGLPHVHARMRRVLVWHGAAIPLMKKFETPECLYYLDPPYHPSTRAAPNVYGREMTDADHVELLQFCLNSPAKIMISGYRCDVYDDLLNGWARTDFDIANHAAGGEAKRDMVESVWTNFKPEEKYGGDGSPGPADGPEGELLRDDAG